MEGFDLNLDHVRPALFGLIVSFGMDYFSWIQFALYAIIYSALIFSGELSKDGPRIFSNSNARTQRNVIWIHTEFLLGVLVLMKIAVEMQPRMPNWTSGDAGKSGTYYELIFFSAIMILGLWERRMLFVAQVPQGTEEDSTALR